MGDVVDLFQKNKPKTDTEKEIELVVDAQTRANNCLVEIENALHKWQCTVEPVLQISAMGIKGTYMVVPLVKRSVA